MLQGATTLKLLVPGVGALLLAAYAALAVGAGALATPADHESQTASKRMASANASYVYRALPTWAMLEA
jgi:hypothetical protein